MRQENGTYSIEMTIHAETFVVENRFGHRDPFEYEYEHRFTEYEYESLS